MTDTVPSIADLLHAPPAPEALVSRVRRMREAGVSIHAITKRLNADKVPTARGGRWQSTTIERMLARSESPDLSREDPNRAVRSAIGAAVSESILRGQLAQVGVTLPPLRRYRCARIGVGLRSA